MSSTSRPIADLPDPSDVPGGVRFALVDVFGEGALTGNPLAVLDTTAFGQDGPPEAWMRAVAREMNQAETTFVLPPTGAALARLRSYTAGGVEVFGAGHNALGAWWWLLETGRVARPVPGGRITQEIGGRELELVVEADRLVMYQDRATLGGQPEPAALAAAIGLTEGDLDPELPPRVVGTGADHLMAGIRDGDRLAAARCDKAALVEVAGTVGAQGVYLAVLGERRPVRRVHTRFFNPGVGLDEDPATGSAAGPLIGYLRHLGLLSGECRIEVCQGESVGRPSLLHALVTEDGVAAVGGTGVITAQGWLRGPGH